MCGDQFSHAPSHSVFRKHRTVKYQLGLHRYDHRQTNEILRSSEYLTFTLVRDPWSWLVSGFLNKFVDDLKPPGLQIINKLSVFSDSIPILCLFSQVKGHFHIQPALASPS